MKITLLKQMQQAAHDGDARGLDALLGSVPRDKAHEARAAKCLIIAIQKGHDALASGLMAWGTPVDACYIRTPLVLCAEFNRANVARELIARGADIERATSGGTPLLATSAKDSLETAQVLVSAGADVEGRNGSSPLCRAAIHGSARVAELLLQHGALADPPVHSPLCLAIQNGHFAVAQVLVQHGARLERASWGAGGTWNALDFARSQHKPNAEIIALLEASS